MAPIWRQERRSILSILFDLEANDSETELPQVLCASLAGVVERVNKLISVTPVKTRCSSQCDPPLDLTFETTKTYSLITFLKRPFYSNDDAPRPRRSFAGA